LFSTPAEDGENHVYAFKQDSLKIYVDLFNAGKVGHRLFIGGPKFQIPD
jgi:hypothetical protein